MAVTHDNSATLCADRRARMTNKSNGVFKNIAHLGSSGLHRPPFPSMSWPATAGHPAAIVLRFAIEKSLLLAVALRSQVHLGGPLLRAVTNRGAQSDDSTLFPSSAPPTLRVIPVIVYIVILHLICLLSVGVSQSRFQLQAGCRIRTRQRLIHRTLPQTECPGALRSSTIMAAFEHAGPPLMNTASSLGSRVLSYRSTGLAFSGASQPQIKRRQR